MQTRNEYKADKNALLPDYTPVARVTGNDVFAEKEK